MALSFGLLDQSPITAGGSEKALKHTVELAQLADKLGFDRIWVSEHHGSRYTAGKAPEVLIAYLLASTQKIKVGSGGILLQHYSPYKIAEVFHVLAGLGPGRIELGIGRSPGGLPPFTQALQQKFKAEQMPFERQLAELLHYLRSSRPGPQIHTCPQADNRLPVFLLGSSETSVGTAVRQRLNYAFASFFDNQKELAAKVIRAYKKGCDPAHQVLYSPAVIIAETEQRAKELAEKVKIMTLHFKGGKQLIISHEDDARAYIQELDEPVRLDIAANQNIIYGTGIQVAERLAQICRDLPINGFVFHLPVADHQRRLDMIRELAHIRGKLKTEIKEAE